MYSPISKAFHDNSRLNRSFAGHGFYFGHLGADSSPPPQSCASRDLPVLKEHDENAVVDTSLAVVLRTIHTQ